MKNIIKSVLLLALFAGGLAASAQASITIRFFTKVAGYSSAGWIEIVDGAPKAKPAKVGNKWITDRIQRGEPLLVKYSTNKPGPCDWDLANATITINGKKLSSGEKWLPDSEMVQGAIDLKNPNTDKVMFTVKSKFDKDKASRPLPIGTR